MLKVSLLLQLSVQHNFFSPRIMDSYKVVDDDLGSLLILYQQALINTLDSVPSWNLPVLQIVELETIYDIPGHLIHALERGR